MQSPPRPQRHAAGIAAAVVVVVVVAVVAVVTGGGGAHVYGLGRCGSAISLALLGLKSPEALASAAPLLRSLNVAQPSLAGSGAANLFPAIAGETLKGFPQCLAASSTALDR